MKMTEMRTTVMSTRLGVNQLIVSLCGASVESIFICLGLCNKHCNGTFEICLLMCATVSGAHMSLLCILFCS